MIRAAQVEDRVAVEAIVQAAYAVYVNRIGRKPGPMLDEYAQLIAGRAVSVLEHPPGDVAAVIVLLPKSGHLLLDNVAVRPDRQG